MHKLIKVILLFLITILFVACTSSTSPESKAPSDDIQVRTHETEEPTAENELASTLESSDAPAEAASDQIGDVNEPLSTNIHDYFPFRENFQKHFQGVGNEFASFSMHVQYMDENRIQFLTNNGGTQVVTIYEKTDNEIKVVFVQPEVYYRERMLDRTGDIGTYLRGPVEVGTTWVNVNNQEMTITDVNVMVEGISSIEVKSGSDIYYFGYQVGLIKQILNPGDFAVVSTLDSLIEGQPVDVNYDLIYQKNNEWKTVRMNKPMYTNDFFRLVLQNDLQEYKVLNPQTKIESLYKNRTDDKVYLNISKEFYDDITTAQQELAKLQSIVRTIAPIYGSDQLYIWVDNMAYQGPFIKMAKNELLKISE